MDEVRRLNVLRDAWQDCVRCELGKRRSDVNGHFVFGEGVTRSILFVGEGPGKNEEREGRPFVGRSGKILRGVMEKLGINDVQRAANAIKGAAGKRLTYQTTHS